MLTDVNGILLPREWETEKQEREQSLTSERGMNERWFLNTGSAWNTFTLFNHNKKVFLNFPYLLNAYWVAEVFRQNKRLFALLTYGLKCGN